MLRRVVRWFLSAALAVIVAAGAWGLYLWAEAGQFRRLEAVALGDCLRVEGAPGAEDIDVLASESFAFISSDDRRIAAAERPQGGIYGYPLRTEGAAPVLLSGSFGGDFHPHGLYVLEGVSRSSVFVVNHPASGPAIEVFDWQGGKLEHRETVTDPLLVSPNDVAALDDRRFYITNDHGSAPGLGALSEDLLRRPRGNVVFWDGERMRVVIERVGYANGVSLDASGSKLFVASTSTGRILEYQVAPAGDLSLTDEIVLGTGVDNIDVDRHGYLWVAAHPHLFTFLRHAGDPAKRSPSEGLWVDPDVPADPQTPRVRTAFLTRGEELSGSSVVVPFGSRLIIGSVFEPFFLVCERRF